MIVGERSIYGNCSVLDGQSITSAIVSSHNFVLALFHSSFAYLLSPNITVTRDRPWHIRSVQIQC
jgi:hypothetical protein